MFWLSCNQFTYTHTVTLSHTHIHTLIHTLSYIHTHMSSHTFTYSYTHSHAHTCICIYMFVCAYICVYIYPEIFKQKWPARQNKQIQALVHGLLFLHRKLFLCLIVDLVKGLFQCILVCVDVVCCSSRRPWCWNCVCVILALEPTPLRHRQLLLALGVGSAWSEDQTQACPPTPVGRRFLKWFSDCSFGLEGCSGETPASHVASQGSIPAHTCSPGPAKNEPCPPGPAWALAKPGTARNKAECY